MNNLQHDLTGRRVGYLTVERRALNHHRKSGVYWECLCECGIRVIVASSYLIRRQKGSCGCRAIRKMHGQSHTELYQLWCRIKNRVFCPTNEGYADYGGRGISMDPRWASSFETFRADVGERPSPKHSLDRIDTNGHYEPGNVRWATVKEQNNNTRATIRLTYRGQTKTLLEWAQELGKKPSTLRERRARGWPTERILEYERPAATKQEG